MSQIYEKVDVGWRGKSRSQPSKVSIFWERRWRGRKRELFSRSRVLKILKFFCQIKREWRDISFQEKKILISQRRKTYTRLGEKVSVKFSSQTFSFHASLDFRKKVTFFPLSWIFCNSDFFPQLVTSHWRMRSEDSSVQIWSNFFLLLASH